MNSAAQGPADKAAPGTASAPHTELSRDLKCFDITMIGVGAMIGAGIFVLTGIAAGTAGPALMLAFALNGIIAYFTAMVYAELGSAIPEAGGGYLWIKEGLPGGNAFISGWMSWFAHAVAGSLYALGFGSYFGLALGNILGLHLSPGHEHVLELGLTAFIIVLFVFINYRGASETGLAGNIVTVAKVAILLFFIVSGMWVIFGHPSLFHNFQPLVPEKTGTLGIFAAMGLTFIAFEGYEIIVQAGEEVKDPRRNVPRAVFWCMAIVLPIYILVAFVAVGAVHVPGGSSMPTWAWLGSGNHPELRLVDAAKQFMPLGTILLLLGGVLSTMSALNATTFSSTRVAFAMGRDRNLPDLFSRIHQRTRTPVFALLISGVLIMLMAETVPIEAVAAAADIMFLLLFLQVNVAAITIRKKYGDKLHYGYLTPFFPVIPVIGIVANLGLAGFMVVHYLWPAGIAALAWLAVGWCLWLFYAKPRERGKTLTPVLISEQLPTAKKRFRVLVPVANPATAEGLMRFAGRLAQAEGGEVIVLHTLVVPPQLPPSAARHLIQQARPVMDKAVAIADGMGVSAAALARVSHTHAWRAIVDTAEEYDADFIVLGWRGRPQDARTVVGSNIDKVVSHVRCNIAVLQSAGQKRTARVLAPVEDLRQGELLLNVGRVLANGAGRRGKIDLLLHVQAGGPAPASAKAPAPEKAEGKSDDKGKEKEKEKEKDPTQMAIDRLEELAAAANQADPHGPQVSVIAAEAGDPAGDIIERCQEYDMLVLGSTSQSWFRSRVYGSLVQRVAGQVQCPLVLVSQGSSGIKHNVQQFFEFFRNLEEKVQEEAEVSAANQAKGREDAQEQAMVDEVKKDKS